MAEVLDRRRVAALDKALRRIVRATGIKMPDGHCTNGKGLPVTNVSAFRVVHAGIIAMAHDGGSQGKHYFWFVIPGVTNYSRICDPFSVAALFGIRKML